MRLLEQLRANGPGEEKIVGRHAQMSSQMSPGMPSWVLAYQLGPQSLDWERRVSICASRNDT